MKLDEVVPNAGQPLLCILTIRMRSANQTTPKILSVPSPPRRTAPIQFALETPILPGMVTDSFQVYQISIPPLGNDTGVFSNS